MAISIENLDTVAERIRGDFEMRSSVRDSALQRTRELIRVCGNAIRASHRDEWPAARRLLKEADELGDTILESLERYPDLRYAGYTRDALKELVEAHVTLALVEGNQIPEPEDLNVTYPSYLNGMCEAASELRRRALDEMREGNLEEAERLLGIMDNVYDVANGFDFPNAITGGLRHRVDQLRGVLERTRGDLTSSLQQDRLIRALHSFEPLVEELSPEVERPE